MKPRRFVSATTFSMSCSRGTVKLACYSPPGVLASRAGRPPHCVGRQISPPRVLASRAGRPLRGEANSPPHCVGRQLLHPVHSLGSHTPPPGVLASRAGRPPHCVGRRMPLTLWTSFGAGMLATSGAGPGDAPAALSAHPRSIRSIPHRVSTGDTFEYLRLPSVEELLLHRAGQAAYLPARSRRKGIRPRPG